MNAAEIAVKGLVRVERCCLHDDLVFLVERSSTNQLPVVIMTQLAILRQPISYDADAIHC
jgi:hypothetical protein